MARRREMICLWKETGHLSDLVCSGGRPLRCAPTKRGVAWGVLCDCSTFSLWPRPLLRASGATFMELIGRSLPAKIRREDVLDACSACFVQAMLLAVCKKLRRAQAERDELIDAAQPTATRSRRARAF